MWKLTEATRQRLNSDLAEHDKTRIRRERIRDYIAEHNGKQYTRRDLAVAAGYDMSEVGSKEYNRGSAMIRYLIKTGQIEESLTHDSSNGVTKIYYWHDVATGKNSTGKSIQPVPTVEVEDSAPEPNSTNVDLVQLKLTSGERTIKIKLQDVDSTTIINSLNKAIEVLNYGK